jgi:hypothetical protein
MSWLLAWLILNALVLAWRLRAAMPEIKTRRQSIGAKRVLGITHRA